MRRPAVFFDRDNTLIIGNEYLGDPAQVVLVAGAAAVVAKCREMGFAVVVVSNQSGVARGLFSEDDVRAVDNRMAELLLQQNRGAVIDRHEFCPFHPDAKVEQYRQDSFLRKPKPGMILAAAEAMALDLGGSWMVGDAPRDITAGQAAGCRTILIMDPTLPPSAAASETTNMRADFVVSSLIEAAEVITRQVHKSQRRPDLPQALVPTKIAPGEPLKITPLVTPVPPPKPPAAKSPTAAPTAAAAPAPQPVIDRVKPPAENAAARSDFSRLEAVCQQLLTEVKKFNEHRQEDFSLSKLIAGISQILALAALPLAYVLYHSDGQTMQLWLLTAVFLQTLTVALLIMGRQR